MATTANEKHSAILHRFRHMRTAVYLFGRLGGDSIESRNAATMLADMALENMDEAMRLVSEIMGDGVYEPVTELIDAYQSAEKAYNDAPIDDQAKLDETREIYCATIDALKCSDVKAVTPRGVEAALRQALKEECDNLVGEKPITLTIALLEMAVGYFEGEGALMAKRESYLSKMEREAGALTVNSTSMIEEAIALHKMLVEEEGKLYREDGKPLARKAKRDAALVREIKAFRILVRMPCATPEEAQMKLAYFLDPVAPNVWSNMERLTWEAYLDEEDKGSGEGEYEQVLMRSLIARGNAEDLPKSDPCAETLAWLAYLRARQHASSTLSLSDIKASAGREHFLEISRPADLTSREHAHEGSQS